MLNLLSLIIGLTAVIPLLVGLIPLFGWVNWLLLPIAVVGLVLGSLSSGRAGRNLNLVVLIVAVLRLALGHGFL